MIYAQKSLQVTKINMKNPTVSIIIPVYNRPLLLKRALFSVLHQSYKDWEAIIVDDGSTDNTAQVAIEFSSLDSRFKLIQTKHGGNPQAINAGIRNAKGKFITFLDSDDEYDFRHLEIRLERILAKDRPDFLHSGFRVVGDTNVVDKRDISKLISLYDQDVYLGGTFFGRQEVYLSLEGFRDIPYASDSDFLERAKKQFNVIKVEEPTYIYHREHEDSFTKKFLISSNIRAIYEV